MPVSYDYQVATGATAAVITAVLYGANGLPVPFAVGDTCLILVEAVGTQTETVHALCTITKPGALVGDPLQGQVTYAWQAADLATPGDYYCQFKPVYANGKADYFPTRKLLIRIADVA